MNKEVRSLDEILANKTERELAEEIIKQNIVVNGKIDSIRNMVGFLFAIAILQIIGVVLVILSAAHTR